MELKILPIFIYFAVGILAIGIVKDSFADAFRSDLSFADQFTESPYMFVETTTSKISNITLDALPVANGSGWTFSRISDAYPKWFEYYSNTQLLKAIANNKTACPNVISDSINKLTSVEGIWVACLDATLEECPMSLTSPCHPLIRYTGSMQKPLRTIKIRLALHGLAIARVTGQSSPFCFDFSARKDPFSTCRYIETKAQSDWTEVKTTLDAYDSTFFSSFTVDLIARFKGDAVLVDKIDATELLICGNEELCTTTPAGTTIPSSTTQKSTTSATPNTTTTQVISTPSEGSTPTTKKPTQNTTSTLHISSFLLMLSFLVWLKSSF